MATWLKQSTAIEIKLGPFVSTSDGFTPQTGLTISQADVRLAKNEGDWAQKNETTTAVHEENGWYRVLLNTTDTDTLGCLIVAVNESGALPVWREFMVMEGTSVGAAVWATTNRVITGLDGSAVDCFFNVNSGSGYTYQFAAGASIIGQIVAAIQLETAAAVWDEDATAHQTAGTFGNTIGDNVGGASIFSNTGDIINFMTLMPAAVWDEDATAHQTAGTFGQTIGDSADTDGNSIAWTVYGISGYVSGPLKGQIRDAVWDADTSFHVTSATFGKVVQDTFATVNASPSSEEIGIAVWNTTVTGWDESPGTFGATVSSLTFTVAGQVDANIQSVNDTTVTGSGTGGDPWGP